MLLTAYVFSARGWGHLPDAVGHVVAWYVIALAVAIGIVEVWAPPSLSVYVLCVCD